MTKHGNPTKRDLEGRGRKPGQNPTDVENPAGRRAEEVPYDAGDLGRKPDVTDTTTDRIPSEEEIDQIQNGDPNSEEPPRP
jgi:hypothetical protein